MSNHKWAYEVSDNATGGWKCMNCCKFSNKDEWYAVCPGTGELSSLTRAPELGSTDSSAASPGVEAKETPKADEVNSPSHYTSGKTECIDAIDSAVSLMSGTRAFYTAQVMKYIWRWPLKGGVKDLKKARWYLNRLIDKELGR